MKLKEIRKKAGITQQQAADLLEVSLRSYKTYENDSLKEESIKYKYLCEKLQQYTLIDEQHGILELGEIKNTVNNILESYEVNFCYLFGSYAKNRATEESDVDLLIDTEITGLKFFGLVENLRTALSKKVDLLKLNQLENNPQLLREILKDGIKIYG